MKMIYGKLESLLLLTCGLSILYYSFSGSYSLLMNPKFKWLTVTGATLLVVMGLAALTSSARRPKINSIVFSFMFLIVLLGRPHMPSASGTPGMEPEPDAGLLAGIDLDRFPRTEFQYIFKDVQRMADSGAGFTIVGTAKRLEELDRHGSFAIMTSVMYCCLADIFATGYRVEHADWENIQDGQPLLICGNFEPEAIDVTVPNFKFGRSMFSTVNKEYRVRPEKIIPYNRLDDLPRIAELLDGGNAALFSSYLQKTPWWNELDQKGPFTIFVPVDNAFMNLENTKFDQMTPDELNNALGLHIIPGRFFTADLLELDSVKSVRDEDIGIDINNGRVTVEGCRLLFKDVEARNGVLHFIYPAIQKEGRENGSGR